MAVNENRREPNRMLRNETQIHITTNIETLAQTAKALIDQGLSVYLGYSHNDVYVNYSSGIMTIAGFNAAPGAAPPSRADRNQLAISANGHVVQIVGYDLGPSGNIIKWKIKNSWGQDAGTNGYFHMYHDYFNTFALDIYFFQDARIPLPATVPLPLPEQRDLFE